MKYGDEDAIEDGDRKKILPSPNLVAKLCAAGK